MPLPIVGPLRARLTEQLEAELRNATVFAGSFIAEWSLRNVSSIRSLPERGELAEKLLRYVGDDPLTTFVSGELNHQFVPTEELGLTGQTPLSRHAGFTDLHAVAANLVDSFSSLPWSYQLTVAVPSSMASAIPTGRDIYDLSPRHRIVSGTRLRGEFPLRARRRGLADLMMQTPAPLWDPEGVYLQIAMEGYFRGKHTEPFLAARDDALAFFGLGVAIGLFQGSFVLGDVGNQKASHFYVHQLNGTTWVEQNTLGIEENYANGIRKLSLSDAEPEFIRTALDKIGAVFRAPTAGKLALSARWMFESECGTDALLQYIQAAVAVEILLGDEEVDPNIGLTTLMANRCAFSIAKTQAARSNLIGLFRKIYKVRSKIVHQGKNRLNRNELDLFNSLKTILRMVLKNELSLLGRAEEIAARDSSVMP